MGGRLTRASEHAPEEESAECEQCDHQHAFQCRRKRPHQSEVRKQRGDSQSGGDAGERRQPAVSRRLGCGRRRLRLPGLGCRVLRRGFRRRLGLLPIHIGRLASETFAASQARGFRVLYDQCKTENDRQQRCRSGEPLAQNMARSCHGLFMKDASVAPICSHRPNSAMRRSERRPQAIRISYQLLKMRRLVPGEVEKTKC